MNVHGLTENRCADCLFLALRVDKADTSSAWEVPLHLTLNFNEQWENIALGRVKFGLRGGELTLTVNNGRVPYSSRFLVQDLVVSIKKGLTISSNIETQYDGEGTLSKEGIVARLSSSTKKNSSKVEVEEVNSCQVSTKGSEKQPKWSFRLRSLDELVLLGLIENSLCYVHIEDEPCNVEARFEVSKWDVWILDAEGIWPRDISANKRAFIEREIVFHLLSSKLQPYLSRIVLPLVNSLPEKDLEQSY
ncbi:hypothetical protein [Nodosilinea sp. LEGE 06152]|uniref:hypothetical protein n=1 Tax=Nodosilinea sp. LEGE 06152 TaxID=2777966 RepID=UPI00187E27FF|nr:hypothetical protein [Nodosilinea sp. LEGE 06152]